MAQTIDFNASSFILHPSSLFPLPSSLFPLPSSLFPLPSSFFLLPSSLCSISQKNRVDLCHPTYINHSHLKLEGESRSDRTSDDIAIIFVLVRTGDPNHTRSNRNIVGQL